jgi:hypothetical protein
LLARTRRLSGFSLDTCPVELELSKPRGKGTYTGTCHVLLPHETLHAFWKRSTSSMWKTGFLGTAGEDGFFEFWRRDAGFHPNHPVHSENPSIRRRTCPVDSTESLVFEGPPYVPMENLSRMHCCMLGMLLLHWNGTLIFLGGPMRTQRFREPKVGIHGDDVTDVKVYVSMLRLQWRGWAMSNVNVQIHVLSGPLASRCARPGSPNACVGETIAHCSSKRSRRRHVEEFSTLVSCSTCVLKSRGWQLFKRAA